MKNKIINNLIILVQLLSAIAVIVIMDTIKELAVFVLVSFYFICWILLWKQRVDADTERKYKILGARSDLIFKLEEIVWKQRLKISTLEKDLSYYKVKRDICNIEGCGGTLIPLPSIDKKKCSNCSIDHEWHLDPGQKSTLIEGLNYDNAEEHKLKNSLEIER